MTNKDFKGLIRTVKRAINGDICPKVFRQACRDNKHLQSALTCHLNKNNEQKELSFKWYRK